MLDKLHLHEVKLTDVSNIQYRFLLSDSGEFPYSPVLVVEFSGECGFGCDGNEDACFMQGIIAAAFKIWEPACCILDLRGLKYDWGDMMIAIFAAPHDYIRLDGESFEYPIAAVVSDLNRKGLTSLVRDEMFEDPKNLLFETIELAYERVVAIARTSYGPR
jgi:hypothetical protein